MKTEKTKPKINIDKGSINITKGAADWICNLLEMEGKSVDEYALCIKVLAGGCSGLQYDMGFAIPGEEFLIFKNHGAMAAVHKKSISFINKSHLTYINRLQGAGFVLINPNVSGSCGCGSSFNV